MCFDEWGPLELRPIGGVAWARRKCPLRRRATYRRLQGTEQFLGFYDVHDDCLEGLFYKHKRVVDICQAFERLRQCYRGKRLFVVLDNRRSPRCSTTPSCPRTPTCAVPSTTTDPLKESIRC